MTSFAHSEDLYRKLTRDMTRLVRERFVRGSGGGAQARIVGPRAAIRARVDREQRLRADTRGRVSERTNYRLVVENYGDVNAENLTIELSEAEGAPGRVPTAHGIDTPIRTLVPGAEVSFPLLMSLGTAGQCEVTFRWTENGDPHESSQTLTA